MKEIHKKSKEYRDEILTNLEKFSLEIDNKKQANYICQMKKAKRRNRVYSLLKFKQGKSIKGGGIERLKVPASWPTLATYDENKVYQLKDPKTLKQEDQWREENNPDEIEFLLRIRNQRNFGQAETDGTPFTTKAMKKKFDWQATTAEAAAVLNGSCIDADMNKVEQLFIHNLQQVTGVDATTNKLTYNEFKGKMNAWSEQKKNLSLLIILAITKDAHETKPLLPI